METPRHYTYTRSDLWREGKWLDMWSVVHVISGFSLGYGLYFLHFGSVPSTILAFVLLIAYEMWEAMVRIAEAPTNRFADVVVGMFGFIGTYFFVAPALTFSLQLYTFAGVLLVNGTLSYIGWRASQKAVALKERMRQRYDAERVRLGKQRAYLRERFTRKY